MVQPEDARLQINEWIENATAGRIKDLLPPGSIDDKATPALLANALYFKGAWERKFDASLTPAATSASRSCRAPASSTSPPAPATRS